MSKKKDLTTTSYAILALLAARPWSAYELAGQMTRGMHLVWPRAESAIYAEPKNLVLHGLAKARRERAGRNRSRSIYTITPKGRRALKRWLEQPSDDPQFESESHLRVMFAEHGSREDALATLDGYAEYGAELRRLLVRQLRSYLADGGPFPDRWHLIALGSRFLIEYAALTARWARWAGAEIESWPSTRADDVPGRGRALFEETLTVFDDS